MNFSKILILKSVNDKIFAINKIIGVVKAEQANGQILLNVDFYLTLPPNLYILVSVGDDAYIFNLSDNVKQNFSFNYKFEIKSLSVCIFEKVTNFTTVLACDKSALLNIDDFEKIINKNFIINKDEYVYDDEQIADTNYYATKGVFDENESIKSQNLLPKEEEKDRGLPFNNETFNNSSENYFLTVENKVNSLLLNNKTNVFLTNLYKNSRFVDVEYSKNNFYSFGVIYNNLVFKKALYVCYVVLGNYNNVPKGFENVSKFIPLNSCLPYDDGYYIIFQDAITGKTIKQVL